MRLAIAVACAACGRINFEPLADANTVCDPSAPFTSITDLQELNSPLGGQGGLRLSPDELYAMWHATRSGSPYELYTATRASRFVPFDPPVNTTVQGFFPTFTPDRLMLIYNSNDLLMRRRANEAAPWDNTVTPVGVVNTPADEVAGLLGGSGTTLYFTRTVGATQDLHVADWPPTMASAIAGLSDAVEFESSAVISADELTIYYAYRLATSTQSDIWTARRASPTAPFDPPTLVPEISSPAQDSPGWLSPDNCRLYIESIRDTGIDYRLYVAERQP